MQGPRTQTGVLAWVCRQQAARNLQPVAPPPVTSQASQKSHSPRVPGTSSITSRHPPTACNTALHTPYAVRSHFLPHRYHWTCISQHSIPALLHLPHTITSNRRRPEARHRAHTPPSPFYYVLAFLPFLPRPLPPRWPPASPTSLTPTTRAPSPHTRAPAPATSARPSPAPSRHCNWNPNPQSLCTPSTLPPAQCPHQHPAELQSHKTTLRFTPSSEVNSLTSLPHPAAGDFLGFVTHTLPFCVSFLYNTSLA